MKSIVLLLLLAPCILRAQTITTVAGNNVNGYSGDGGPATAARIADPTGIAVDAAGNIYIDGDESNVIRIINKSGIISIFAGTMAGGYSGDGGPASAAAFSSPQGLFFDRHGNLFIADGDNAVIREINTLGIVSTVAGNGTPGYSGDNGPATNAQLNNPSDVKVDTAGNIYIADYQNNNIRKVNTSGIIITIAGTGTAGYSGDGGLATAAELDWPAGVALDSVGNLYIADYTNNVIRMVNKNDSIFTVIGAPGGGFGGDGGPATAAKLWGPWGIIFDSSGNLLIVDGTNNRIRKVNKSGIITTVAGNGYGATLHTGAFAGDNGPATNGELYWPSCIAIGAAGSFFIADESNKVIRKVDTLKPGSLDTRQFFATATSIEILPNPNKGVFTLAGALNSNRDETLTVQARNVVGQVVYQTAVFAANDMVNTVIKLKEDLPDGVYLLYIKSETENDIVRFVISR